MIRSVNKMKKVLVTGAYGFLGKYLIQELLDNGYGVIAFGRKKEELDKLRQENVETYVGDFCIREDIEKASENADYIIHAGALSTVWGKRSDFIKTNVVGTKNVLYACKKNKIKRLVYVSSPSIYSGKADRLDIDETDFDENNKLNYYIESKIMAEKLIHKAKFVDSVIIRPRGLFGIGDTSIIPRLINVNRKIGIPLFNNGRNIVDITCVENVALALRLALESEDAAGNTYNITNGEPREFKSILEELFRQIDEPPKYLKINLNLMYFVASAIEFVYKLFGIYKEPMITKYNICTLGYSQTLNIDKARRDLRYAPKMTLSEGIKKYAEDHKRNKVL